MKNNSKKKNVSSGLRSTIKWQAGKHMARQEERSKFYWWLLRYLQQPKNTYINIPDILAAQTRVRTSAEGAHTMWDTQVLELHPAAPPLSNLFLHTSIASTTFCAIHLQMSLLIAVTTTRGLLKTRQVCGACWASLTLSLQKESQAWKIWGIVVNLLWTGTFWHLFYTFVCSSARKQQTSVYWKSGLTA